MCKYRKENKCSILADICPWVYWCDKKMIWRELEKAPKKCKVIDSIEVPNGFNKVVFGKRGYLYVSVNGETLKLENPFNFVPLYVKLYKRDGKYKIKKTQGDNKE